MEDRKLEIQTEREILCANERLRFSRQTGASRHIRLHIITTRHFLTGQSKRFMQISLPTTITDDVHEIECSRHTRKFLSIDCQSDLLTSSGHIAAGVPKMLALIIE